MQKWHSTGHALQPNTKHTWGEEERGVSTWFDVYFWLKVQLIVQEFLLNKCSLVTLWCMYKSDMYKSLSTPVIIPMFIIEYLICSMLFHTPVICYTNLSKEEMCIFVLDPREVKRVEILRALHAFWLVQYLCGSSFHIQPPCTCNSICLLACEAPGRTR